MHEYEELRRVCYGDGESEQGRSVFVPVCPNCARFVKADSTVSVDIHGQPNKPNATCSRCGRVEMLFEGYF